MTISAHLRKLNNRLSLIERCAEIAPDGTYQRAKDAAAAVADASNGILAAFRDHGFNTLNDDRLRNLEAAIYGYLLEGNPDECGLMTGEGFGEHVDGPAGEYIMANTIRDRNALARIRAEASLPRQNDRAPIDFDEPPQPVDDGSCDPLYGQRMDSADMGEC